MTAFIRKHAVWLSLLPVLAVMVMIFLFSAQNGEKSGHTSEKIVRVAIELTQPDFDSLPKQEQVRIHARVSFSVRKLAHFTEFAMLGFTLMLHVIAVGTRTRVKWPPLWAFVVGALYAVTDELHQGLVSGRSPAALDVGIDSLGVLCGVSLLWLLAWLRKKMADGSPIEAEPQE